MDTDIFSNKNMRYIMSIYRNRGISKAAKELYITQPALSKFLIAFEERLGFPLFDKIGYSFIPTYAGERFIHYAQETAKLEQQLAYELDDLEREMGGRLRLALPLMRGPFLLPDIAPEFISMYPNVRLSVMEAQADNLEPLILENKVDFAIVNRDIHRPGLVCEHIYDDRVLLAVPRASKEARAYAAAQGDTQQPVHISDFLALPFVLLTPAQQLREVADRIFSEAGVVPNVAFTTKNIQSALSMVSSGFGACIFAETYLREDMLRTMAVFPLDTAFDHININLIYWRDMYMPQYFKAFIAIVERLRQRAE